MDYSKYLNNALAPITKANQEIYDKGEDMPLAHVLDRKDKNELLNGGNLKGENGYYHHEDGGVYVAALTKMPNVTVEMIDWWFWWYAAESVRYQIWYPGKHFKTESEWNGTYNDESKSHQERLHNSIHFVTEDIGAGTETLAIDFRSPEAFGFDMAKMEQSKTKSIICAKGGFYDKGVWTTDFCHAIREIDNGIELRSRFWIGYEIDRINKFGRSIFNRILNFPSIKRKLIPKDLGRHLFYHCSQEYSHLATILPELYLEANSVEAEENL